MHHALVIEGEEKKGIEQALAYAKKEFGMLPKGNPDVVVLKYGLLSVEDARRITGIASQAPIRGGTKVIIIAAGRAYHEAQSALLKLFEEPPIGTYLLLILPNRDTLLPTLRSRVQFLGDSELREGAGAAEKFLKMNSEKRSAYIKRLATGRDEDERRGNKEEAIVIINGIEQQAFEGGLEKNKDLLRDIATLRGYLYDRSAPLRMILEHISRVLPKNLG